MNKSSIGVLDPAILPSSQKINCQSPAETRPGCPRAMPKRLCDQAEARPATKTHPQQPAALSLPTECCRPKYVSGQGRLLSQKAAPADSEGCFFGKLSWAARSAKTGASNPPGGFCHPPRRCHPGLHRRGTKHFTRLSGNPRLSTSCRSASDLSSPWPAIPACPWCLWRSCPRSA